MSWSHQQVDHYTVRAWTGRSKVTVEVISSCAVMCGLYLVCYGTAQAVRERERVSVWERCGNVGNSERQEGFPLRHFFHTRPGVPFFIIIMRFTVSCPVAGNTVWTAPRSTRTLLQWYKYCLKTLLINLLHSLHKKNTLISLNSTFCNQILFDWSSIWEFI